MPVFSSRMPDSREFAYRRSRRTGRSRRGSPSPEDASVAVDMLRAVRVVAAVVMIASVTGCLDPVDPGDADVAMVQVTFDGSNTADTIQVREMTRAHAAA